MFDNFTAKFLLQPNWISNILLQEGTELFFSQRYYTIKANSLMFGVSRKVLLFKKLTSLLSAYSINH